MAFLLNPYIFSISYELGEESAQASESGSGETGSVTATARFTFNSNGTVTALAGVSSPYTNWNAFGGGTSSYISYKLLSGGLTSAPMGSSADGSTRVQMNSNRAFTVSASAGTPGQDGYDSESVSAVIEVWVWNAASGGSILAKGKYNLSAFAEFNYTGDPL
jgi:hypothetical protein